MNRYLPFPAIALLALAGSAFGQSGYAISGGLSNFDVGNHCDDPCDEFEIEIEGIHPEDVYHCYRNGNYGAPSITQVGSYVRIDYHHPAHNTPVGGIEHFGVSLRNFSPANSIRVHWLRNGALAAVNGHIPLPGGGSAPNSQPLLPSITTETVTAPNGDQTVALTVTNNDPAQAIWIQRRADITAGEVTLEALMRNDPVVTGSFLIDAAPFLLGPSQSVTLAEALDELEAVQTAVFSARALQDVNSGGPFGQQHIIGPEVANVMTATITGQSFCGDSGPLIIDQPVSVTDDAGSLFDISVNLGTDDSVTYQWRKDGLVITETDVSTGTETDTLRVAALTPETEGIYHVTITSPCGTTISGSAIVLITGDNGGGGGGGGHGGCHADFNDDGNLDPDDLADYIGGFFDANPPSRCDFNDDGSTDPDDMADFIGAFFDGC